MGLLDKPSIAEEVRKIKAEKENKRMRFEYENMMGLRPLRRIKRRKRKNSFKANMPKKMRKEWGERMNHLRAIK